MANVADIIAMTPTYLPYERPPDPSVLWTAIPRGLRGFVVEFDAISIKPVNDTLTLNLTATLPPGFAYIFSEIGLRIALDLAADFDTKYSLNLQNYYQGGFLGLSMTWNFDFPLMGLGNTVRCQGPVATAMTPRQPIWAPRGTSGILIDISTFNATAGAAAGGTFSAYINFWEFDLEQIRKFPINAPLPTHVR